MICLALLVFNVWLGISYSTLRSLEVFSEIAVATTFAAAGVAAWILRSRSRIGPWMLALGIAALLTNTLDLRPVSAMPGHSAAVLVGEFAIQLQYPIAGFILLAYPSGRLAGRLERALVTFGFVAAVVIGLVISTTLTPDPAICHDWCYVSPIQLIADRHWYLQIRTTALISWVVMAVAALALLVRRALRSTRRQRRVLGWVFAVFVLEAVLFGALSLSVVTSGSASTVTTALAYAHQWVAVVAIPIVFFVGLLRQRLEFASIGVLVRHLDEATPDTVEAAMQDTLHDPDLRVLFPAPSGWVDVTGRPFEPHLDPTRAALPLGNPPVAMLVHDPSLADNRELLESAASAARLALDNARLRAQRSATTGTSRRERHTPAPSFDRFVFISYSRGDRTYVAQLAGYLTLAGISVWYDNHIAAGERFARSIQRSIESSAAVLAVMSPAAMDSAWVDRELSYAIAKHKTVVPLLLIPCEVNMMLVGLNWEDVVGGRMPTHRFVGHLRQLTGAGTDRAAVTT